MTKQPKPGFIQERPQKASLNQDGHEIGDSRPLEVALNLRRAPSLTEQIRAVVRSERLKQEAIASGHETFEEADDFEIGDDYDPESPYEMEFEPEEPTTQARAEPAPSSSSETPTEVATPEPTPSPDGGVGPG